MSVTLRRRPPDQGRRPTGHHTTVRWYSSFLWPYMGFRKDLWESSLKNPSHVPNITACPCMPKSRIFYHRLPDPHLLAVRSTTFFSKRLLNSVIPPDLDEVQVGTQKHSVICDCRANLDKFYDFGHVSQSGVLQSGTDFHLSFLWKSADFLSTPPARDTVEVDAQVKFHRRKPSLQCKGSTVDYHHGVVRCSWRRIVIKVCFRKYYFGWYNFWGNLVRIER